MALKDLIISEPYPPGYWTGTRPLRRKSRTLGTLSPSMERVLRMLATCGGQAICGPYLRTYQALQRRGLVRLMKETNYPRRPVAVLTPAGRGDA